MKLRANLSDDLRFTLPVIAENMFTSGVSLIYSAVTGAISPGALAASSVANQAMNLVFALFAMLTVGSAILVARQTGRGDSAEAASTAEAAIFMGLVSGAAVMLLLLAFSGPIMKLLMPGAEKQFFSEGTVYYRLILISVPPVVLSNSAASMLRAAGNSRQVLASNVLMNLVQLLCVWLFTGVLNWGIRGTALATVVCRYVNALYLLFALARNRRGFHMQILNVIHPQLSGVKHIFTVGFPATVDSMSVQLCYVTVNSMLVSIGKTEAGIVSVLNSVLLFTGVTQGIGSAAATTLVGQRAGSGDIEGARRKCIKILLLCEGVSMALCIPAALFSTFSASLFSEDADIIRAAAGFMWVMFPYCFVAVGVNVCEPAARVGGEVRFTMLAIVGCVWLIRLPLTYLLAIRLNMGVEGIYAANILSLGTRFLLSFCRIIGSRWGKKEI